MTTFELNAELNEILVALNRLVEQTEALALTARQSVLIFNTGGVVNITAAPVEPATK